MAAEQLAAGLIKRYSESPIIPQFSDRYVVGAKANRKSIVNLQAVVTDNMMEDNNIKRRSLVARSSLMLTTHTAAENPSAATWSVRDREKIQAPDESLDDL